MRIEIPTSDLINRLKINKFIKIDSKSMPQATARKDMVNFSHAEMVNFYNHRIQGLVTFYSFAVNRTSLRKLIMFLHLSCALTLALKLKLRTKSAVFSKLGRNLTDPDTGIYLKLPDNLKAIHKYNGIKTTNPENDLKTSWFTKMTKSVLNQKCVICQSTNKVEMHHIRKVKDVRGKIRTGNSTYAQ